MLFHHVGVHVADLDNSMPLYDAIFEVLGYDKYLLPGHSAAAWGTESCSFRVVQPPDGKISASSSHICFSAPSAAAVAAFFETGQRCGATGVAAPEAYVEFGHRHLTAMLSDADGNYLEAVYVDPAPADPPGDQAA